MPPKKQQAVTHPDDVTGELEVFEPVEKADFVEWLAALRKYNPSLPNEAKTIGAKADRLYALRELKRLAGNVAKAIESEFNATEKALLLQMDTEETTKGAGKIGSVTVGESEVFTLKDWNSFVAFVQKHKYHHLFQRRLSLEACREAAAKHKGLPGCEVFIKRTINLRAS